MWYKGVSIASLGKVRTSERLGDVGVSGELMGENTNLHEYSS